MSVHFDRPLDVSAIPADPAVTAWCSTCRRELAGANRRELERVIAEHRAEGRHPDACDIGPF